MTSRYTSLVPEYANRAFEEWYAYETNDEKYEEFAGRWGGFEYVHFLHALEQGQGNDRLLSMFALGASSYPDAVNALVPFLYSVHRDERCVSAIVLGTKGEARAYPFLETCLLDGMSLEERQDASARGDQEALEALFLCDRFRPNAIGLLEAWFSPTYVQTLLQALQSLWIWEKASSRIFKEKRMYAAILYALGKRDVFTFLDTLSFPPTYRKIAKVYLALGALQIPPTPTFQRAVMKNEDRIKHWLEDRFLVNEEEAQKCIEVFYQEKEICSAYRSGLSEQEIGELIATHFMVEMKEKFYLVDGEEGAQEEKRIIQREPARVRVYRGHTSSVWSAVWSPDGQWVASGGNDTTVQIWNYRTGEQVSIFRGHTACVTVVAWSPDGQWVASGGCDNRVFVWNAQTGEIITTYTHHNGWICNGLAWSPDGVWVASASWDGTVHIWEARTGQTCLRYHGHQGVVTSLAWSPDGEWIASGGGYPECAIHVWNAQRGQTDFVYKAHMQDITGTRPVPAELLKTDEAWVRGPSSLRSVAWSPDGRWIASVGLRNVFRVWHAQTGENLIAEVQNRTSGPLAWSTDSTCLATVHRDGVDIWNISLRNIVLSYISISRYPITTLSWAPDMRTAVSGGEYPSICVWEVDI